MIELRGIGWDHPRCTRPLEAAALAWERETGVGVRWDFRSLSAFNDQPPAELSGGYDLLVIDHPHVPAAAEAGALLPLDLLDERVLAAVAADSLGPNYSAYVYDGRTWALPIDCACHVSAGLREERPASWDEVLALARAAPGSVALSLTPADSLCCLLTLCAEHGVPVRADRLCFASAALELLVEIAAVAHPCSFELSPPELLDRMLAVGDVRYAPLGFGYLTHARRGVVFGPPPLPDGAILGGAGIAVSAQSESPQEAARFCGWLASAATQRTVVLPAGGQPASAAVWADPGEDDAAAAFCSGTAAAVESAYVRPQLPGWPRLHDVLGRVLAAALARGESATRIAARLYETLELEGAA